MSRLSKRKKIEIICTIIFLVAGLVAMLVGFQLSGWSLIRFINSPYFATLCVGLIVGGLVGFYIYLTLKDYENKD